MGSNPTSARGIKCHHTPSRWYALFQLTVGLKMSKVTNNLWRVSQTVKTLGFHPKDKGSTPLLVTNSLLTFYLSLHYGWRLTLKSQYEPFASAMKYIGAEPIWLTGKFDKFVSH